MGAVAVYKHSGRSGHGYWSIPVVAIPATLILSVVYGYVCIYTPCVGYISVFLPFVYGSAVAYVVGRAAKAARCRSDLCVTILGLVCGLVALYAGWVVFLYALLQRYGRGASATLPLFQLFLTPSAVWSTLFQVNQSGWFKIKNATPSGIILWICWAGEAAIILGYTLAKPRNMLKNWVYCETCDQWCKEKDDLARFGSPDAAEESRIKTGDLTVLAELKPYPGGKEPHIRLDNRRCDSCGQLETVRITKYWYEQSDKDQNEKSEELTPHFLLDAGSLGALQNALVAQAAAKAGEREQKAEDTGQTTEDRGQNSSA